MSNGSGIIAILLSLFAGFWLIWIAIIVLLIIANWKLFEKAGKPGWAAIVPIYNVIVLFEIIGYKWYYIFVSALALIPIVGSIALVLFAISYSIKLAKSFGQSTAFGIGLWLLSPIFIPIIAFSSDIKYVGPSVNGDIDFNDLF